MGGSSTLPNGQSAAPQLACAPCGFVSLILGCMFSGKTTELLRRIAARPACEVLAVKHAIDTRFARDAIVSHAGKAIPAVSVTRADEIIGILGPRTTLVAIDEAHFFDAGLVDAVSRLKNHRLDVAVASLEPDSWARPFPINEHLRAVADECILNRATCARCGGPADRTQRLTPIVGGRMVVDPSNYEPRCANCWRPPVVNH